MPKKILLLCLSDDPFLPPARGAMGGSALMMYNLAAFLVRKGNHVTFLVGSSDVDQPVYERIAQLCHIWRIPVKDDQGNSVPYYAYAPYCDHAMEFCQTQFDCSTFDQLISYNWNSGIVACDLAKHWNLPHLHFVLALARAREAAGEGLHKITAPWRNAEIRIFNEADKVVAASTNELNEIQTLYPECAIKDLQCIHIGIDIDVFSPCPRTIPDNICRATDRFTQGVEEIS